MKPIRISFARSQLYVLVWLFAGLLSSVAIGIAFAKTKVINETDTKLSADIARLSVDVLRAQEDIARAKNELQSDPERQRAQTLTALLKADVNPAFSTFENVDVAGARLLQFTIDLPSDTVRVEYEVDTLAHANELSAALNAGFEKMPWRLEGLGGSSSINGRGEKSRAAWNARLSTLK